MVGEEKKHTTDATWSKWVALITEQARIGNTSSSGNLGSERGPDLQINKNTKRKIS